VLDPHKWLFQPYDIGCAMARDARHLERTFRILPEYLRDIQRGEEEINLCDYGLELTRRFRALKLWMSLKVFGLEAFRDAVARGLHLAETAEELLRARPGWEVVTPAQLGIVTARYRLPNLPEEHVDALQQRLVDALIADGFAMVATTVLRGRAVLRLCTINPRTTEADLEETIARIEWLARREHHAGG